MFSNMKKFKISILNKNEKKTNPKKQKKNSTAFPSARNQKYTYIHTCLYAERRRGG